MALRHYDFIEIGTSDFNTLIKKAKKDTVGLSVEPLGDYLARLPDRPNVTKVEAAVSDSTGTVDIYYIPDDVRVAHGLPDWMKGTNKIGAPHPTVVRYLTKRGLPLTLMAQRSVPMVSIDQLFKTHGVGSVEYLKIDTEGHDSVIMYAYLDMITAAPGLRAKHIRFESNCLTPKATVADIVQRLKTLGYDVDVRKEDTHATLP